MRLVTSERAKRDIEDIARYIALDSSQSAEDLRKAVSNAFELMLHTPEMGSHRGFYNPALDNLRMVRLQNFKKRASGRGQAYPPTHREIVFRSPTPPVFVSVGLARRADLTRPPEKL